MAGWILKKRKCPIPWWHLYSFLELTVNIRTFEDVHNTCPASERLPVPFVHLSPSFAPSVFFFLSHLLVPFFSSLPPTFLSLPSPSVRRCGKRHVLSFPQCSASCQCRRWNPSRHLCLCWALWFTVRGHPPRTGNLWKLPFWHPSLQVSI